MEACGANNACKCFAGALTDFGREFTVEILEMLRAGCRSDVVDAADGESEGDDAFHGLVDEPDDEQDDVADPHGQVCNFRFRGSG